MDQANSGSGTGFSTAQYDDAFPEGSGLNYWHLTRKRILLRKLDAYGLRALPILDIGCGTGTVVGYLRAAGLDCTGSEIAEAPVPAELRPHVFSPADAFTLPEAFRAKVGVVLLLDVLEHLDDPVGMLRSCRTSFPKLSAVLATVPARGELWSNYDTHYGHRCRYETGSFAALLGEAGLSVKEVGYFFHALYWPARLTLAMAKGRATEMKPPRMLPLHRALATALDLEERWIPPSLAGDVGAGRGDGALVPPARSPAGLLAPLRGGLRPGGPSLPRWGSAPHPGCGYAAALAPPALRAVGTRSTGPARGRSTSARDFFEPRAYDGPAPRLARRLSPLETFMKHSHGSILLVLSSLALLAGGWACSASKATNTFGSGGSGGSSATAMQATGGGGGAPSTSQTTGLFTSTGSTGGSIAQTLVITPMNPVLVFPSAKTTVPFQADSGGTAVTATWSIDNVQLGDISATGVFTAGGMVGGTANVSATFGKLVATTTITVQLHLTENVGNVPPASIAQLKAGGTADPSFRWLYPFDQTVWPRGLAAPTLQLDGAGADAVWIHAETKSKSFVYDGYYGPSGPTQVAPSAATWNAFMESAGPAEPLVVSASKVSGGQATGPKTETWTVAQGSLKGTVYYNSYDSLLASGIGAVLKIKPGTDAQLVAGGNGKCVVCHTVAGNGSAIFAADNGYTTGGRYNLTNGGAETDQRNDYAWLFPAVTPDGTLTLATSGAHIGGMWGDGNSALYDVATGQQVSAQGFDNVVQHAACPSFSGDGKLLAFDWEDMGNLNTLTVMSFNQATLSFSNLQVLVTDPANYLGWPSFLPDSSAILFDENSIAQETANADQEPTPNYGTWFNYRSNLGIVDIKTHTVTQLDALNGMASGQIYLPWGADDYQRNFEPNVAPLPVGGYNWVVFTSRRQYGNTINNVQTPQYGDTARKKLWIAAIDLHPTPGKDPSHPAIYLPGQEASIVTNGQVIQKAGNMRGFWVFDPCQQNGTMCDSGDECCGGFCREVNGAKTCVPPPAGGCSQEFEKCTKTGDCCGAPQGFTCVNGFCVSPTPM